VLSNLGESGNPALSGLSLDELAALIAPLPRYRAAQIFKWIASGVSGFDAMGNLPRQIREELAEQFSLRPVVQEAHYPGSDGTVKLALEFSDGAKVETVLLPGGSGSAPARYTACLSTQAGCPAGCVFCKTGSLGFFRNLDSAEMVEQFLRLREIAEISRPLPEQPAGHSISGIVVMGMGEPLLNINELRRALAVITCKQGLHFSARRITVSTCGIADGIVDLADKGPAVRLALSLTTADENLRRRLMPITASQPLARVKKALRYFQDRGGGRVTLEMVLLGGINTGAGDARRAAEFAGGLDTVVNLIPWNPVKGLEFEGKPLREPSAAETASFATQLKALGLNVTRRFRRGRGVAGACGQLGCSHIPTSPT
jgi:23S rRNA (adenine2503-C2)-methyltransferase